MAARFSALGESEEEGVNGGSSSAPWRLEATCDLIGGPAVGVRMPQCIHAAAMACGWSATESTAPSSIQLRTRLKPDF
jgi:hypothetical protein